MHGSSEPTNDDAVANKSLPVGGQADDKTSQMHNYFQTFAVSFA